ncbi:MarR family winged helix-turn-helix transcriptional regulator [Brevibacterium renqingii]|uniref:MarR family winged helix-turn-helix transcriptional regulator n=1 Tax=Brevibacterium renqingii TaxID=2776916 RepID=UPI001ADF1311|nr:MarR family transcriptional regulator [Brevibacterium renqingii]
MRQLESEAVTVWRSMLLKHADLVDAIGARLRTEHGLIATEFDVLINIPPHSTIRHRDLVDEIVLSRSALSRLLRRLEQRGLIEQRSDDEDQRGICVELTEGGRVLREASAKTNAEVVDDAFALLDSADLTCLSEAVGRIRPAKTGE